MARVGVPFHVILDAYETLVQLDDRGFTGTHGDPQRRLEHLSSMIELIEYWVASARNRALGGGEGMNRTSELSSAIASGGLMPKLDIIRSKLETMPDSAGLLQRIRAIEEAIQFVAF